MPFLQIPMSRLLSFGLALSLAAAGGAQAADAAPSREVQPLTITADGALRRPLAPGVYEMAYSAAAQAVYVASAEAVSGVQGGVIYKLDPETLQTLGKTYTDEKNYGLTVDPSGAMLYITNSTSQGVSAMDTKTGRIVARTAFKGVGRDGFPYGTRKVRYDERQQAVYVSGVGNPGKIWLLDGKTLETRATIENAGKWVTGLLLDPAADRLYAANGDGEILVIDTRDNRIAERWKTGDGKEWLLLNLALDKKRHRLFATDNFKQKAIAVFDTQTGRMVRRIEGGDALDVVFDPARDRLSVSHRRQGTVSVLDGASLETIKTYALPQLPNSLLLGPEGESLYVTIKTPGNKDHSASGPGSVARIHLP